MFNLGLGVLFFDASAYLGIEEVEGLQARQDENSGGDGR